MKKSTQQKIFELAAIFVLAIAIVKLFPLIRGAATSPQEESAGTAHSQAETMPLAGFSELIQSEISQAESTGATETAQILTENSADSGNTESATVIYGEEIPDEIIVDFIDVGQGDSTLIYDMTTDFSCLIDTGYYDAYDNVQAALKEYGIENLDVLILTHPDTDHMQSAVDVIRDYNVPKVYMSKAENPDAKAYAYLKEYLDTSYEGEVMYPGILESIDMNGSENAVMMFLGPWEYTDLSDTNGNSLIVKLWNGDNDSFLFMGDATGKEAEAILENKIRVGTCTVYKASHHGSANDGCNSEEFIDFVDPEYMVISCGYQNEHGHPHKETMEIAQDKNIKLFRTDLQGSISCRSDKNGLSWNLEPTDVYTNGNGFR